MPHQRHQTHRISLAARSDGTILAVRDRIWLDLGAYNAWGIVLPYNTVAHLLGPLRVRDMAVEVQGVVTHKTPNAPYRGAGRPEVVFAMDRAVDGLARQLGVDPAEIRRRNYLTAAELPWDLGMPYRDGNPLVYDSGDFRAVLDDGSIRRMRATALLDRTPDGMPARLAGTLQLVQEPEQESARGGQPRGTRR